MLVRACSLPLLALEQGLKQDEEAPLEVGALDSVTMQQFGAMGLNRGGTIPLNFDTADISESLHYEGSFIDLLIGTLRGNWDSQERVLVGWLLLTGLLVKADGLQQKDSEIYRVGVFEKLDGLLKELFGASV